jgi:hypothetical protein
MRKYWHEGTQAKAKTSEPERNAKLQTKIDEAYGIILNHYKNRKNRLGRPLIVNR